MSEEWGQIAALMSGASVMWVWYSLLFVVVEGYVELGCHDCEVDALLANEEYVNPTETVSERHFPLSGRSYRQSWASS